MKSDTDRLPRGWKRLDDKEICGDCWRKMFVLRAVSIPVVSPLDSSWDEFGAKLREQWGLVTRASNWMLTQMYARDDHSRDKGKLQPMPAMYLYPEARPLFSGLPSQTCAALEQAINLKYRARRYEIVWTATASLPTYRYPSPFPVPKQGWSVVLEDGCPIVSARIGDERIRFRLRSGHQFRRQLTAIKQISAGEAERGQMDLYRKGRTVMCKMVAWLPRTPAEARIEDTLIVRTDAESLLVAVNLKDERLWVYHADQARKWVAEHTKRLQRLSDDTKAEARPVPAFAERRKAMAAKFRDRMDSLTHQASAMVVNYAKRRKFARIRYDDHMREFCPSFPWATLKAKLADKANVAGIEFDASADAPETAEAEVKPDAV